MTEIDLNFKEKILLICKKHDVEKVALFGSIVKEAFNEESDIDILVNFRGRKSLFDLVRLERELEQALHRKVDVITYKSLHPLLKERILQEQVVIS
ncbi:MAG: nucleotidyltransferase family protein [Candidatus Hodarchaeales archaeon]|jgi:predicted nucleotidyltransferase